MLCSVLCGSWSSCSINYVFPLANAAKSITHLKWAEQALEWLLGCILLVPVAGLAEFAVLGRAELAKCAEPAEAGLAEFAREQLAVGGWWSYRRSNNGTGLIGVVDG